MVKRQVYSSETGAYLRTEEIPLPRCGVAVCVKCGECITCHAEGCYYGGVWYPEHVWISYDDALMVSVSTFESNLDMLGSELITHRSKFPPPKLRTRRGKLVKSDFVYVRGG